MNIYLDIETLPCQLPGFGDDLRAELASEAEAKKAEVRAPSNYKDEAKIAEYVAAARQKIDDEIDAEAEKKYRATALDGTFGEVFCVAWAIDGGDITVGTLYEFFEAAFDMPTPTDRPVIIGHNVPWDIRFMWQSATIKGIPIPRWWPVRAKPWDDVIFDTMTQWAGIGNKISLEKLCKAFGIKGKGGFDGSMVYDAWLEGKHDQIREYCADDVMRVRELHKRIK
jgi:3'-5' exonuclease